jgi:hypothetical protein
LKMGNKGLEAALAAVEMANLRAGLRSQVSGARKGKTTSTSRKRKPRS